MNNERPDPDQLLAHVQREESVASRGKLRLFFGYAAGVGKTYAMLQAAQALRAQGTDVVVGYVEPHGREETEALLEGLERLPTLSVVHRGAQLKELDLNAALRKPAVIIVDELAHTNAPGMCHAKRWQDVEELLAAGIGVYSTVNVQHVESLNDVVAQVSGVTVRETIPDEVLERADDVVLIDLPPDALLERLRQGKVYVPRQAAHALERFFRKDNLVALRELALRQTADRVHEDVETARRSKADKTPWPTSERLLVCVGPSPSSAKVVRTAKRLADRLGSEWIAVHIESSHAAQMGVLDRERLHQNLRLAESLGAETVQLSGEEVSRELLEYASHRNVTKIVVGKTDEPRRWPWVRPSLVDRLIQNSGNIDVFVVRGVDEPTVVRVVPTHAHRSLKPWIGTGVILAVATAVALGFHYLGWSEANLVMVFLLGVVIVAARYGAWPSVVASFLAVLLFDVVFTEPYYRVTVEDTQYLVTFTMMLGVGLLASTLTARIRHQADVARRNERRTEALYRLSRRLTAISQSAQLIDEAERAVSDVFDAHAVIFLPDEHRRIRPIIDHPAMFAASASEFTAAQWVLDHNEPAGVGTNTLPSAQALYLPMATPNGVLGVLALQEEREESKTSRRLDLRELSPDVRQLLETYATQIAFAIERDQLTETTRQAELRAETEKLRSSLLAAVSHDIRTPLAGIAGASSTLASSYQSLDPQTRLELLASINEESERLSQLVDNLLHMTRLSSGKVSIDRQWHPVDEVIGSALSRLERPLDGRAVGITLDDELPMLHVDAVLFEQLLVNLIDNAAKYSPAGTAVEVSVHHTIQGIQIEVADHGRGFAAGDEQRVFDLFYRGAGARPDQRGTGIGLAICRAIAEVHGGRIEAHNRSGGGAVVRVTLPHGEAPPRVRDENLEPASS